MAGSGCHFHISLIDRKTGKNVFLDASDKDGVSLRRASSPPAS